jgi:probable F420-dependent oxidoreductase
MNFGLLVGCDREFDAAIEVSVLAESSGFSSIWLSEHHNAAGYVGSPLLALAALAMRTARVRLGPFVLLMPQHHPLRVAEDGAMVDRISRGRFVLAVGLGYVEQEFAMLGISMKERASRMEEGIQIVPRLWTEERVTHNGRHFKLDGASIHPRPVQSPRPPIWMGGWTDKALERAARLSDTWVPGPTADLEALRKCYGIYRRALAAQGKSPAVGEVPACREVFVARTQQEALERGGRPLVKYYRDSYFKWSHPLAGRDEMTDEEIMRDRFVVGDPDACIAQIERFRNELGWTHLICRMDAPGIQHQALLEGIRLFGKTVIPHFR